MPEFNAHISSKLPQVGDTIFSIMSALSNEHNAINLSQGFPGFNCSRDLINLVAKYMRKGLNQYAPMAGVMKLREGLAEKAYDLYSASFNPETEITITAGATQAIFSAITALIKEGDEVIVFTPCYDCYVPAIELAGGKAIFAALQTPDYTIDWEGLKKIVNSRTKMIILNSPHNPTGACINAFDLMSLEKILKGTDIMVLSDEVYEHIVFDGLQHQSVLRFPELASRSVCVFSFGKTYHNTGWKTGAVLAPARLTKEIRKVHQFIVFSVNTPVQHALAEYIQNKDAYLELNDFYQQKRNLFFEAMKASRFKGSPAKGTYFQLLSFKDISDASDTEYAKQLTIDTGVASIPVSAFYPNQEDNKVLRFCFAKEDEVLLKAAEKLCTI